MPVYKTSIFRLRDGRLATNIPRAIPRRRYEWIMTPRKIRVETGALQLDGRIRAIIHEDLLREHNIDPMNRIAINLDSRWLYSHFYHNIPSGGVWISAKLVREFNVRGNSYVEVYVYGLATSLQIEHLNRVYPAYGSYWVLPDRVMYKESNLGKFYVEPERTFGWAVDQGLTIYVHWYPVTEGYVRAEIRADTGYTGAIIAERNNKSYRSIRNRNFLATVNPDEDYFKAEMKASYLSMYPRNYHSAIEKPDYINFLRDFLNITVHNLSYASFLLGNAYISYESEGVEYNREIDWATVVRSGVVNKLMGWYDFQYCLKEGMFHYTDKKGKKKDYLYMEHEEKRRKAIIDGVTYIISPIENLFTEEDVHRDREGFLWT